MNWHIKAALQKILALSQIGDRLNHMPVLFNKKYHSNVYQYQTYECFRKFEGSKIQIDETSNALEIGTGYSVLSPVCLALLGFNKVVTVDISRDLTFSSFRKQIEFMQVSSLPRDFVSKSIYSEIVLKQKIENIKKVRSFDELFEYLNIVYLAPYKFEEIEKESLKFDYIVSQVVLEHMPPKQLELLFFYTKKWLSENGIAVHCINFIDHFANPGFFQDKSISEFNFLKYSDKYWDFWSGNSIAYTNRLSFPYYVQLAKKYNLNVKSFNGENYRKRVELDTELIHPDILRNYNGVVNKDEIMKYQRGTFVMS
ncbi:methyltransferase domain-containing protein [Winogradskyella sp. SYSU M77433]|uniref:methyltransferase domain-containing protein n=1 Tax=Winogradskyella sp. SYSU M77433 TaxID=3042722 RepID=UPI00248048B8|nr:methyltransferase domain-containing protein [Winogradskyella sp. SYSU M77433]MDH7914078.1 methyltransferase domain-containing protein [Winogradskyella sp. SYSU M77433]